MVLTLELHPGGGLGGFYLGLPICEVLAHVQEHEQIFQRINIKYSEQAPLQRDLVLDFPNHGFHLRFHPVSQRLRLIEVYDITLIQLRYAQSVVGGPKDPATFLALYHLLGPTYPGTLDKVRGVYLLHYPGLLLLFPIQPAYADYCANLQAGLPLEFPDGTTPVVRRISIYHTEDRSPTSSASSSTSAAATSLVHLPNNPSRHLPTPPASSAAAASPQQTLTSNLDLALQGYHQGSQGDEEKEAVAREAARGLKRVVYAMPPKMPPGSTYMEQVRVFLGHGLHFTVGQQEVLFGHTPQDVWDELGPPGGVTYKRVDTMVIHAGQEGSRSQNAALTKDYFYNYYNRGIDVLFDGQTHRVKKFVLHTNAVGHVDFNIYIKCNFVLNIDAPKLGCRHSDQCSTSNKAEGVGGPLHCDWQWTGTPVGGPPFIPRDHNSNPPSPLPYPAVHMTPAASNPFPPTYVYGYRNVVLEVMKNGHLASITLFRDA